jgi:hypothetical protein
MTRHRVVRNWHVAAVTLLIALGAWAAAGGVVYLGHVLGAW